MNPSTEVKDYKQRVKNVKKELQSALLQVSSLQEELEITLNQKQALEKLNELLKCALKDTQKKCEVLKNEVTVGKTNAEQNSSELPIIKPVSSSIPDETSNIEKTKKDMELARLQIQKLQEELERYYIKSLELESRSSQSDATKYVALKCYDVLRGAFCSEMGVIEFYEDVHYSHLGLKLCDLVLADGRQIDLLECKLVNNSGFVGLEIRAGENGKQEHLLDSWPEELNDEFGQKVLFHPGSPSSEFPNQQVVEWQMSASDRVLFFGVINSIKEHFTASTYINSSSLTGSEVAAWQRAAVALFNQVTKMPDWLSFDTVSLKEEMRLDNYEHLWLSFNNLLHGVRFFDTYQVKVNVTELGGKKCFANHLAIEFRALPNNKAPLESWPPSQKDEYGYWLQVDVDLTKGQLMLDGAEELSETDVALVKHLLANFKFIVERLRDEGQTQLQRNWDDWIYLSNKLHHMHQKSNANTLVRRTKRALKRFVLKKG